jgi:putative ABC transport system permease protein
VALTGALDIFMRDFKYAARMLLKSPGFTIVAVLSLALGIGANTAIFSLINVVLLRPLPVADVQSLVTISTTDQRNPGNLQLSHLNFRDLRAQNSVFTDMAGFSFNAVNYTHGAESEPITAQVVTANYFSLLGVQPALGRGFLPEEETKELPVAVISDGFWSQQLGSDPNIVGKTISLNRTAFTIVGVAPRGFTGTLLGGGPAVWIPMTRTLAPQPTWWETRRGLWLFGVGRLKPGVTVDQARANLKGIFGQLESEFPTDNRGRSSAVVPLLEARLNPAGTGPSFVLQLSTMLMAIVGIVLLIACANIANLLLARATKRRREIAIRLALGAKRSRLIRQLLAESVLLSVLGGGAGLLVAYWSFAALKGVRLPLPIPVDSELTVDPRVLLFTLGLSVATGLLFGLVPALQGSKTDVVPVLKNELVPSAGGGRGWRGLFSVREGLVVLQVALSLVSLIAAGLFVRDLRRQQTIDPGFQTATVLVAVINLARDGYTPERGRLFIDQAIDRLSGVPGVTQASVAENPPLAGNILRSVYPEGSDTTTRDRVLVLVNPVSVGYFNTVGVPIVRGREFTTTDTVGAPQVVVINETMAERFWPGQDPIGKRFKFFGDPEYTTVVGVARDSKYIAIAENPTPYIYESLAQNYTPGLTLHVRTSGSASRLAAPLRQAIQQIDPKLSVFNVRTVDEQVAQSLQPLETNALLLAGFGLLALLLASIGLYGVTSYAVSQRTREIGVRMALGANPATVLGLVLGRGMVLVAVGVAAGLVISLLSASVMRSLVAGVNPRDPVTFVSTAVILLLVALTANFVPARRATRIDPLVALRTD